MRKYEKPIIEVNNELAEGVYAASGDIKCDSKYMQGQFQAPIYTWVGTEGFKAIFGCQGCRAYRGSACGLLTDYLNSSQASSYDADAGRRMPAWEYNGCEPYAVVTGENMNLGADQDVKVE